jgi:hypothetical protein
MQKIFSKEIKYFFFNYLKMLHIPISSLLFVINDLTIHTLSIVIIPSHELLVIIFTSILLVNVSSLGCYFDKTNFSLFSKYFNHWVSLFFTILNRTILIFLLAIFTFLTIYMIYMEFLFGTIFVAKENWEYSWVFKIPLLFWIFLIGFYSIVSLKPLLLPFSPSSKK